MIEGNSLSQSLLAGLSSGVGAILPGVGSKALQGIVGFITKKSSSVGRKLSFLANEKNTKPAIEGYVVGTEVSDKYKEGRKKGYSLGEILW